MLELAFSVDRQRRVQGSNLTVEESSNMKEVPCTAVFVVNSEGRVVKTNASALRILDRASGEVVGQYYWRFLAVFRTDARLQGEAYFSDPVLRSLSTEKPQLNIIGLLYRRGGIAEPFDGAIAPVYEGVDGPRGAVIIVQLGVP